MEKYCRSFLLITMLSGISMGAHAAQSYSLHVDGSSGLDLPACGNLSNPCLTVGKAMEIAATLCPSASSVKIRMAMGQTYYAPELRLPCNNMTVESYDPAVIYQSVAVTATDCFAELDKPPASVDMSKTCARLTAAEPVDFGGWVPHVGPDFSYLLKGVCTVGRGQLFSTTELFQPGEIHLGSNRLPENLDFGLNLAVPGYTLDPGSYAIVSWSAYGAPAPEPSCTNPSAKKVVVYRPDSQNPPQDLELAAEYSYVLSTAGKNNIEIQYVDFYGTGFNQIVGPSPAYTRLTGALVVEGSDTVSVHDVRTAISPFHSLSIFNGASNVTVRDTDISMSGLWCADVRHATQNVLFERVAFHHCGGNLGDILDGHGFGSNRTLDGLTIRDSVFYENGFSAGLTSYNEEETTPPFKLKRQVKEAAVFFLVKEYCLRGQRCGVQLARWC